MKSYGEYDDNLLVSLLKQEDKDAFNEIYNRYWRKLYSDCYRRLKDDDLSADVIQDIFADLWIKRTSRNIDNLAAYLFTATRYQVFLLYKKHKNIPHLEKVVECIEAAAMQADNIFFEKELRECIDIWLEMQPEKRKQVFRLKFIDDRSTREISELLNVSQKTVQNQFTTSVKSLRMHLAKIMSVLL
jgi:RNA polymerase sigma factor (sigma-70 family)